MATYDSSLMRVLRNFANTDVMGFTELSESLHFETDLTGYYLRKLQRRGLVEKIDRGQYRITPLGKSLLVHAQQLSGLTVTPRVSIMLVVTVDDNYITVRRNAQPFIGKVEWPTAALLAGEPMATASQRIARERLGLEAQPELHGYFRRIDTLEGTVFDDKIFAVHRLALTNTQATSLVTSNRVGEILRLTKAQLVSLDNGAKSLIDILEFADTNKPYAEQTYRLKAADLY